MKFLKPSDTQRLRFRVDTDELSNTLTAILTQSEIEARGETVITSEWQQTKEPAVMVLEITIQPAGKTDWTVEGHVVAEAVSLLHPIAHAPDRADGETMVARLKSIARGTLIPATARAWLYSWAKQLTNFCALRHAEEAWREWMLWFIAERIAVLERMFPNVHRLSDTDTPSLPLYLA